MSWRFFPHKSWKKQLNTGRCFCDVSAESAFDIATDHNTHTHTNAHTQAHSSNLVSNPSICRKLVWRSMVFAVIDQVSIDLCWLTGPGWRTGIAIYWSKAVSDIISVSQRGQSELAVKAQEHGLATLPEGYKERKKERRTQSVHTICTDKETKHAHPFRRNQ